MFNAKQYEYKTFKREALTPETFSRLVYEVYHNEDEDVKLLDILVEFVEHFEIDQETAKNLLSLELKNDFENEAHINRYLKKGSIPNGIL
jgi:predicted DsbA family dithiol-disulfide isomerase